MNQLQEGYFASITELPRRGRSVTLLQRQDEKIAARFYYYSKLKNKNYDETMAQLEREFDLRERRIYDRLKSSDILDKIFSEKPSIAELRRRFPYLVWG